ncbi:hypothetical protein EZS27_030301 [termite gut metagenome]|uniref:Uncharacterized protein n=1 Tax=termite gut metagenome TaxID=433724 RepID=A0A5J4QF40_9ZZZZ
MNPTINCYLKLEHILKKIKTPRYDCTAFAGYYPPLETLKNKKGQLFFYLMRSRNDKSTTPEHYLQTSKDSMNLTGLFHYWEEDKLSGFCSGYPSTKEIFANKKKTSNSFYENRNDAFLFIIHWDKDKQEPIPTPTAIEMIVLQDAKVLIDAYRKQLMLGGFDEELNMLRGQAKPIFKY